MAGSILYGGEDQPSLSFGERPVGHEVDAAAEQSLEQLVQGKEVVEGSLVVVELDVDVDVAVASLLAAGEGAEDADSSRPEGPKLGDVTLDHGQRIHLQEEGYAPSARPSSAGEAAARADSRGGRVTRPTVRTDPRPRGIGVRDQTGRLEGVALAARQDAALAIERARGPVRAGWPSPRHG